MLAGQGALAKADVLAAAQPAGAVDLYYESLVKLKTAMEVAAECEGGKGGSAQRIAEIRSLLARGNYGLAQCFQSRATGPSELSLNQRLSDLQTAYYHAQAGLVQNPPADLQAALSRQSGAIRSDQEALEGFRDLSARISQIDFAKNRRECSSSPALVDRLKKEYEGLRAKSTEFASLAFLAAERSALERRLGEEIRAIIEGSSDHPTAAFAASALNGSTTVKFEDRSSGRIYSYHWDFGDGSSSTEQNPIHKYSQRGRQYTVTLQVTGPGGSDTQARPVSTPFDNIASQPVAAFTASPRSGPCPLSVRFQNKSTGDISSYSWSFGDGASSSSQNPTHTYQSPGSFSATLVVSGPGGQDRVVQERFITVSDDASTIRLVVSRNPSGEEVAGRYYDDRLLEKGASCTYRVLVASFGDLQVCITPGYDLSGGSLELADTCIYEGDPTIYKRYIREKVDAETLIEAIKVTRNHNSPNSLRCIFTLYPR